VRPLSEEALNTTNPLFVTTAIPYVNAAPHVGFAWELLLADVIARAHRDRGRLVRLQTGTDEHAFKNVMAARALGVPTQKLVDTNAARFRALAASLDVSSNDFIRTTEPRHRRVVDWFWRRLDPADLDWRHYEALYCVGCEDFLREDELVGGVCPDHHSAPVLTRERNLFFRLSKYQARIDQLIHDDVIRILPASRKAEVLAFIRRGLHDFSVSRPSARVEGWGISVPGEPDQIIYVWIDALINYVSALEIDIIAGDGDGAAPFWSAAATKLHVIGKNVWKFHAVYWPALLLSAGLPLPNTLCVHGFVTQNGQKISKSLGNAVDTNELIARYGSDAVRYALLRSSPAHDADFSEERLLHLYTSDLANCFGNTLSRLTSLAAKAGLLHFTPSPAPRPRAYVEAIDAFQIDVALAIAFDDLRALERDIAKAAPWNALRDGANARDEERRAIRDELLPAWLQRLHVCATLLGPFIPASSRAARDVLTRTPITPAPPLFPRQQR
jgi:methionyl-tRNA synthetase